MRFIALFDIKLFNPDGLVDSQQLQASPLIRDEFQTQLAKAELVNLMLLNSMENAYSIPSIHGMWTLMAMLGLNPVTLIHQHCRSTFTISTRCPTITLSKAIMIPGEICDIAGRKYQINW